MKIKDKVVLSVLTIAFFISVGVWLLHAASVSSIHLTKVGVLENANVKIRTLDPDLVIVIFEDGERIKF